MKKRTGSSAGLAKQEAILKQAISDQNIIIRQQIKEIQAADGTSTKFAVTLGLMKKAYRELTQEEKTSDFGKQLLKDINELDEQVKKADASIGNFQRNVGNYPKSFGVVGDSINIAFSEITNGNVTGAVEALNGAFKGLIASARAFITSPIGIAIAALAGIGLAAKELFDYNNEIKETIKLTEQLTRTTGRQTEEIRQRAQVLSETFNSDYKENVRVADKLVNDFGLSYKDAFDEVERGLIRGGAANNEFIDSIREYPVFFRKAGFSAREFIDLINESFAQGVYSDKLVDAIKEADISLREQTKSTRDALVNAFGASFTDDILSRVTAGKTTVKDALIEISNQANKTALSEQQLAKLTAYIFRAAGEDVGGAAKIFDVMGEAVRNTNAPLTKTQQHLENLIKANNDLEKAMSDALKSDSVISLSDNFELLWVNIKTGFFEALIPIREFYEWGWKVLGRSETIANIWDSLKRIAVVLGNEIGRIRDTFIRLGQALGLSVEDGNKFTKALQIMLDPVKHLEVLLSALATTLETASNIFGTVSVYAEAFGRTLAEIQIAITNLDLSKLLNLRKIFLGNAQDVIDKNEEQKKSEEELAKLRKAQGEYEGKQAEKERQRRVEDAEAARKKAELQKKYAEDEKKRFEESKRRLSESLTEELSVMTESLRNFEITTKGHEQLHEGLTDTIVREAERRADTILAQQIKIYEQEASIALSSNSEKQKIITYAEVKAAYERGDELNSIQLKLLNKGIEAEKKAAEEKIKIRTDAETFNKKLFEDGIAYQTALLKIATDNQIANGKKLEVANKDLQDAILNYTIEQYETFYSLDEELLKQRLELGDELENWEIEYLSRKAERRRRDVEEEISKEKERAKRLQELKDEVAKTEEDQRNETIEAIGKAVGMENYWRELSLAYYKYINAQKLENEKETQLAGLQLTAAVASASAAIVGEQTAFGKVAASVAAAINTALAITKVLADPGGVAGIALAAVIGVLGALQIAKIASQQPPPAPKYSGTPQFEHGVVGSTYEGVAIKDEAGAEIHIDRHGNVKDWGSDKGARKFKIKKGDTILPNKISERVKGIMEYTPMPDLMASIQLNGLGSGYDFNRLEKKLDKVEAAIKKKENVAFIDGGGVIIEVTKAGGNTMQRFIPKGGIVKPKQKGLK